MSRHAPHPESGDKESVVTHMEEGIYANVHQDMANSDPAGAGLPNLKLDRYGNPMVPQPSDDPNDPLNWPYWYKVYSVVLVCTICFMSQLGNAVVSSALVPISEDFHVTVQQTSYTTTTYILAQGVIPMFVVPFASIWGRKPIYILSTLVHIASQIGAGGTKSYATLIVTRIFGGGAGGVALALAPATIADLFPLGERGLWTGFYVLLVNNGPHVAPIFSGYVANDKSWRWCYYVPAIAGGGLWIIALLTLRETLFSRVEGSMLENKGFLQTLRFQKVLDRKLKPIDFVRPFIMLKYICVTLPALFFATANMFGSALYAVTGAAIARAVYKFDPAKTGLWLGVPLTIGCMIGEFGAGWVSDYLTNAHAKRHDGRHSPETRLLIAPGTLIMTAGIISFGYTVQNKAPWIQTAVCLAVTGVGLQFASTSVYTYVLDCYKPQGAECGAVLNLVKNTGSFTVGFYALPWARLSGYGPAWLGMSMINVAFLIIFSSLYFVGPKIRTSQGIPNLHKDL